MAGGGTLVTFPTLIWIGLPSITANATSTVAILPGSFGAMVGYRAEMRAIHGRLYWLMVPSFIGGVAGAYLLRLTPTPVFDRLVPLLILFATLLFMSNGVVNKRLRLGSIDEKPMGLWWTGAIVFQFFSATYGGYFGAGNGILMLAAMGLLGLNELHRANGIKNFLGICINAVAVLIFAGAGYVVWEDALLMACGALIGGYFGAKMAMRVGQKWVRRGIVLIGWIIFFVMVWKVRQHPQ